MLLSAAAVRLKSCSKQDKKETGNWKKNVSSRAHTPCISRGSKAGTSLPVAASSRLNLSKAHSSITKPRTAYTNKIACSYKLVRMPFVAVTAESGLTWIAACACTVLSFSVSVPSSLVPRVFVLFFCHA